MIPAHIIGMHRRAHRKCMEANRRWFKCLHFIKVYDGSGRSQAFARSKRGVCRARMHAREEVKWMRRLNVILPYVQDHEWVPRRWIPDIVAERS